MEKKVVVSTRKLRFENKYLAQQEGFEIYDYDFLKFKEQSTLDFKKVLAEKNIFIITSMHAANILLSERNTQELDWAEKSCYCLQGKIEKRLRAEKVKVVNTASNGTDLFKMIEPKHFNTAAYLTSNIRLETIEKYKAHTPVKFIEVYHKEFVKHIVPENDCVLFFSPSQINAFLLNNKLELTQQTFCIGKTTADYLRTKGYQKIEIPEVATEENLINKLIERYKQ